MMDARTKEAVRYLGFGRQEADEATLAMVARSFEELKTAASPRIVWRIFDLNPEGEDSLNIGGMKIHSKSLCRNMKGCCQAVVLGATLGAGVDLLMRRQSLTDMAGAVVTQACAAAMLEEYLDGEQEEIGRELEREGKYLRPRFSPGYCDFFHPPEADPVHAGGAKKDRPFHDGKLYADSGKIRHSCDRSICRAGALPQERV